MRLLVLATALISLTACSSSPVADPGSRARLAYTDGLAAEWKLAPEHKQKLQYYVSDTIRLLHSVSGGERGIADGRLVASDARAVKEVVVDSGTPGVLVGSGKNWMAVSFEEGSYLYFVAHQPSRGIPGAERPDPSRYYLYVPSWNGKTGAVKMNDRVYSAVDSSPRAFLTVDKDSIFDSDYVVQRQEGRLVQ